MQPSSSEVPTSALTPREREVLELVARGLRYKQVATRLDIAIPTVKAHVASIAKKVPGRSRPLVKLTRYYYRHVEDSAA